MKLPPPSTSPLPFFSPSCFSCFPPHRPILSHAKGWPYPPHLPYSNLPYKPILPHGSLLSVVTTPTQREILPCDISLPPYLELSIHFHIVFLILIFKGKEREGGLGKHEAQTNSLVSYASTGLLKGGRFFFLKRKRKGKSLEKNLN